MIRTGSPFHYWPFRSASPPLRRSLRFRAQHEHGPKSMNQLRVLANGLGHAASINDVYPRIHVVTSTEALPSCWQSLLLLLPLLPTAARQQSAQRSRWT